MFFTAVLVVVGVAFALKFFGSPLTVAGGIVVVIAGFVFVDAIKTFNGGWFDLTQDTPWEIANPPRNSEAEPVSRTRVTKPAVPAKKASATRKSRTGKPAVKRTKPIKVSPDREYDPQTEAILAKLRARNPQ